MTRFCFSTAPLPVGWKKAFHGQGEIELEAWISLGEVPDNTFFLMQEGTWVRWWKGKAGSVHINVVPKQYRTWVLLEG